ncbi:MAG: NADH-quinone oxidoreductase subunit C [Bacteroidetes bacterium]|nr:NADH-quinone oxidoreductase subunit C [Bacteroidota bacterium]
MDKQALLTTVGDKLKAQFGEGLISSELLYDYPVFTVKRDVIIDLILFLYNDEELAFQYLTTMAAIHYPDNKGQELALVYQLHNLPKNLRIRLKIFFPISDPHVPTLTPVFSAANWMEREAFDFYGVIFTGHPNLKRILNMEDMTYHPLRKEYPLEDGTREDKDDRMFGR